ncbi:hypothetical protein CAPTEDRAFT_188471, partial [Capitella teleta]
MEQRFPLLSMEVSQDAAGKLSAEHCCSSSKEPGSQKCTRGTQCYEYNCFNYNNRESTARGISFHQKKRSRDGKCGFKIAIEPQSPTRKLGFAVVHFESSRFKQTKKNKRLTDSAVPTLFDLPNHLQKTSRPRATATSKRAAEPLSVQCVAVSADVGAALKFSNQHDHTYEPSEEMVRSKVRILSEELKGLKKELKNTAAREQRAKERLSDSLQKLKEQNFINAELHLKLEAYE